MKVTLLYDKRKLVMDVGENDSVGKMKVFLRDKFNLNIQSSQEREDLILHVTFAGSYLQDDWILSDIGIPPGSTLQCILQSKDKIFLRVYSSFNDKMYEFTEPINLEKTTVETMKSMIQDKSGIPVSMFRLRRKGSDNDMFDARLLSEYDIKTGDTIYIDIWDGMSDFLNSVFAGDVTATMDAVVDFHDDPFLHRYQLRVALFIAAFQGNIQLAAQLLKSGSRCDDPVGEHPARDWCKSSVAHPLSLRTPAHAAAQRGRGSCLRLFIHHNRSCILAKDGHGSTPTALARRFGQQECFKLLVTEQFRKLQYAGLNLSIYGKVRKWCDRAKDRVAFYRIDPDRQILLASLDKSARSATVGSLIQLNGFGESIQSSATKLNRNKIEAKNQWLWPMREKLVDISRYSYDRKSTKTRFLPSLRKQNSVITKRPVRRTSSLDNFQRRGIMKKSSQNDGYSHEDKRPLFKKTSRHEDTSPRATFEKQEDKDNRLYKIDKRPGRLPIIAQTETEMNGKDISTGFFITQGPTSSRITKEQSEELRSDGDSRPGGKNMEKSVETHKRHPPKKHSFFNPNENKELAHEAHSIIRQATGKTSRQFARASLELGETFTAMGWLRRLQLANNCNRKTLLRNMEDKGQALRQKCRSATYS